MEVILKEDVPALGKAGEVVRVKEGFARNFLLPRRKALPATAGNLKSLELQKKHLEAKRERLRQEAEALSGQLASIRVTLEKQAGEEDKIFGQVTTREIAQALAALGYSIDRRLIRLTEPIRTIGTHTVEVHLHGEVVVPVAVDVKKK